MKRKDFHFYDLNGKKLQEGEVKVNERSISIANLSVGIYFLQLSDDSGARKTVKLVKE